MTEIVGYQISPQQNRSWLAGKDGNAFFSVSATRVNGPLDRDALKQALDLQIAGHEILSSRFVVPPNLKLPLQEVLDEPDYVWHESDWSDLAEKAILQHVLASGKTAATAMNGLHVTLARLNTEAYLLVMALPAIYADGESLAVLHEELWTLYSQVDDPPEEEGIQFSQYSDWLAELAEEDEGGGTFWLDREKNLNRTQPAQAGRPQWHGALNLSGDEAGLLATWFLLLARMDNRNQLTIAVNSSGRSFEELETAVGPFSRFLPVTLEFNDQDSFQSIRTRVADELATARQWQDFYGMNEAELPPLTFGFRYRNQKECHHGFGPNPESLDIYTWNENLGISLDVVGGDDGAQCRILYDQNRFNIKEIDRLSRRLSLLHENQGKSPVAIRVPFLLPEEKSQLVEHFNDTAQTYNLDDVVPRLFQKSCLDRPGQPALVADGCSLSFEELNQKANRLAHFLQAQGIGPQGMVGLLFGRSPEAVVAILAVLKTGATFLPLDPHLPQERLRFQLSDSGASLILTQSGFDSTSLGTTPVVLDDGSIDFSQYPSSNPNAVITREQAAYVVYTSGSTGQPKAVVVTHGNLTNYLNGICQRLELKPGQSFALVSTLAADLGNTMLYPALCTGGTLHLLGQEHIQDGLLMAEYMATHRVDCLKITPSHLTALMNQAGDQKVLPRYCLVLGGEATKPELISSLREQAPNLRIVNHYGPSETTVGVITWADNGTCDNFPLGRPIGNTQIHLFNGAMTHVPSHSLGEIFIGGKSVAMGYLNRPALTAERFLPDPHGKEPGSRLYRTGDLARFDEHGHLYFMGRMDHQVKIRGYRVELPEIEKALLRIEGVQGGLVVFHQNEMLVAYIVPSRDTQLEADVLRTELAAFLPDYMVPSRFIFMDAFPLNSNGKINRKALPEPNLQMEREYVAPRTVIEEELVALWQKLLGEEHIGVTDGFFELGGHSLLLMQVLSQIKAKYNYLISMAVEPTIEGLANQIEQARNNGDSETPDQIQPRDRKVAPRLSFAQERLFIQDGLETGQSAYMSPHFTTLDGPLDKVALDRAFTAMTARHESLRVYFQEDSDGPRQKFLDPWQWQVEVADLSDQNWQEQEAPIETLVHRELTTRFDLSKGPLLRCLLIKRDEDRHLMLFTCHHIIWDAVSTGVFMNEFWQHYQAFTTGESLKMPPMPIQYADYAEWEREWLSGENYQRHLSFWKEALKGAEHVLNLPTDYQRPKIQTYNGDLVPINLDRELNRRINAIARNSGATPFMALLSIFGLVLGRYCNSDDLLIGTPVANRTRPETTGLIGFFVNMLVIRADMGGNPSFQEFLGRVQKMCFSAYEHQAFPFNKLVQELDLERDLSRNPLFQVMFSYQNGTGEAKPVGNLTMAPYGRDDEVAQFDLTLNLTGPGGEDGPIEGELIFNTDLFKPETMGALATHFLSMLTWCLDHPNLPLDRAVMLTPEETKAMAANLIGPPLTHSAHVCLHQMFEAQASTTPLATALIFSPPGSQETTEMTYAQLETKANLLAADLRKRHIGPEVLVAVCMDRCPELLVALLAVHKAGGAYVPLDPNYPRERIAHTLADAKAALLLTQEHLLWLTQDTQVPRLVLDAAYFRKDPVAAPLPQAQPENLAYVIYTSGSTGRPKGVPLTHHNAATMIGWAREHYDPADLAAVFAGTSICFDLSIYELFLPLSMGGTVVLGENMLHLADHPARNRVTLLNGVPSAMTELLEMEAVPPSVGVVNLAGEPFSDTLLQRIYALEQVRALYNLYGPSEDTTYSTGALMEREFQGVPPIGEPLAQTRAYILDRNLCQVPKGVPGQLYLAGDGLSRGYLGRPGLSAEKFICDPFNPTPGARMYATGDLVRQGHHGLMVFVGRIDHQVKLRGYRIELGEIESLLSELTNCSGRVVMVREDRPGHKQLVAYLEPSSITDPETLKSLLGNHLPDYMIPAHIVMLDQLPLTANGKINRMALPAPETGIAGEIQVAPQTEMEKTLSEVWCELLNLDQVDVEANFFKLGGHSLLAARLVARLQQRLGLTITLPRVFERPTIAALATFLENLDRNDGETRPVPRENPNRKVFPISPVQQRLWFLDQLEPGNAAYNIPALFRIEGNLQMAHLEMAVDHILSRHENLRTSFTNVDGQPMQVVRDHQPFKLDKVDLRDDDQETRERKRTELIETHLSWSFDIQNGPLIRFQLIREEDRRYTFMMSVYHIVFDGMSLGLFLKELCQSYDAFCTGRSPLLPPLELQYADLALWQHRRKASGELQRQLNYWRKRLDGAPTLLELPTDRPRPSVQTYSGGQVTLELDKQLSGGLRNLGQDRETTLFVTLLTGYAVLLSHYTRQESLLVGTPVANRDLPQTEPLLGFFVNTLVLRCDFHDNPNLVEMVDRLSQTVRQALAHKDVPFNQIVEAMHRHPDLSHNPIFQAGFLLQQEGAPDALAEGVSMVPLKLENKTIHQDLTLVIDDREQGGGFKISLNFNSDIFDKGTAQTMLESLGSIYQTMVETPATRVRALNPQGATERALLDRWNQTEQTFRPYTGVHQWIEQTVTAHADAKAVTAQGTSLTYGELNARANRLAHFLKALGVGPDSLVAILMEPCVDVIAAILGIHKAGGAYLPLDARFPSDRVAEILTDAGVTLVLSEAILAAKLPGSVKVVKREDWEAFPPNDSQPPALEHQADNLAYVLFTSGSTGKPKGVAVAHSHLLNYLHAFNHFTQTPPSLSFAMVSTLAADLGNTAIFPCLVSGGCLHLVDRETSSSPHLFGNYMQEHEIQVLKIVPGHLEALMSGHNPAAVLPSRMLVLGGEQLSSDLVNRIQSHQVVEHLFNSYGPTETTVAISMFAAQPEVKANASAMPIGKALANTRLHVLDEQGHACPLICPGELYIGGAGVSRGYMNQPVETAKRFVPDPYATLPGSRLYRTGDRVRLRADGNMEFLGRLDNQVKIRGFRVELGEIRNRLLQSSLVAGAQVMLREDHPGEPLLVAYLLPTSREPNQEQANRQLRALLARQLPTHMVPSAFVWLESFPLNPNGKIDLKALPIPGQDAEPRKQGAAPGNDTERILAEIWCNLLRREQVGIHDSFFGLGGHSLLAVRLVSHIHQRFGIDLPLAQLFTNDTIAQIAQFIMGGTQQALSPLVPIRTGGQDMPLFLVHPVGGNVLSYHALAEALPEETPVYGLQALEKDQTGKRIDSVEAMASAYIAAIRTIVPEGPCLLGGWSLGGVIAWEMAQQLSKIGAQPLQLVLIDSYASICNRAYQPEEMAARFSYDVARLAGEGRKPEPSEFHNLEETAIEAQMLATVKSLGLAENNHDLNRIRKLYTSFKTNLVAAGRYRPISYQGPVTLIRSRDHLRNGPHGWADMASNLQVHDLEGDHYTLLQPPLVGQLAALLRPIIQIANHAKLPN